MTAPIERLLAIMARLRDPKDGCPWDKEQDFADIAPYTIEEAYEVAEAIDHGDMAVLKGELGDLLFQVGFHARLAEEAGDFDFHDVVDAIADKMVRRHPHVFGDARIDGAEAQTVAWEEHKRLEREAKNNAGTPPGAANPDGNRSSALDGVITALPALTRAVKLQKRAARVGFDWDNLAPVLGKVREELAEVEAEIAAGGDGDRLRDELGDLLFCCVNLARKLGIDPETALRFGNAKFERRFRRMEEMLNADGKRIDDLSVDEVLEVYWTQVKAEE
ncbi:MAG: nucleoside triphosphate pyrophosphohydrolase [Proteobacteria bacterium]|nr:nucleoside triphosphate pyrophosphohydrolase [Pseudomonadota bacterium]